jgi:hypothetical protein
MNTLITGTGRAGTSALMQLLVHLKLPTGWSKADVSEVLNNSCIAGLEHTIDFQFTEDIKIFKHIDIWKKIRHLKNLDNVIIPIRNLEDSAKSRARVGKGVNGGLTVKNGVTDIAGQIALNTNIIYELMYTLCDLDIPFTFIMFPKFATDADYLWDKLSWFFKEYKITRKQVKAAHKTVMKPKHIHNMRNVRDLSGINLSCLEHIKLPESK